MFKHSSFSRRGTGGIDGTRLQIEALEPKLPLTASLEVVSVSGGPDLLALGRGGGGSDRFVLETLSNGHVAVSIEVDEEIGGKFDGKPDFTLVKTFDVRTLDNVAVSRGGRFLGFKMEGLAGKDHMDGRGLTGLEVVQYYGGGGDDTLIGGSRAVESFRGGAGSDDIRRVDNRDPVVNGGQNKDRSDVDILRLSGTAAKIWNKTFEIIIGTNQGDKINSSAYPEGRPGGKGVEVLGGNGDDTIVGSAFSDTLDGGNGNDKIRGRGGDDLLSDTGDGNDKLIGDFGDDTLQGGTGRDSLLGGPGNDTLDGGDGKLDVADYKPATSGIVANLQQERTENDGQGGQDSLKNIEGVSGSLFADSITGSDNADILIGRDGNDTINGLGGNDTIFGGAGSDKIDGQQGNDHLSGGAAADVIIGDTLIDFDDASSRFFRGSDTINGGQGDDILRGGGGNDVIRGGLGRDILLGGFGNDEILGGEDADTLKGGRGNDHLEGGEAADVIFFEYDKAARRIVDIALLAGVDEGDRFIAISEFDDPDGKLPDDQADPPITADTGDEVEGDQGISKDEQEDILAELLGTRGNSRLREVDFIATSDELST